MNATSGSFLGRLIRVRVLRDALQPGDFRTEHIEGRLVRGPQPSILRILTSSKMPHTLYDA